MGQARCTCERCGKTMDGVKFYTLRDGSKYRLCKICMTAYVDNFKPDTFLWILKEFDYPWLPWIWEELRAKEYAKSREKGTDFNGQSCIGKYFSKMRLSQHMGERWADSERLQQKHEEELKQQAETREAAKESYEEDLQSKFEAGEISEAEYKTLMSADEQYEKDLAEHQAALTGPPPDAIGINNLYNEDNFVKEEELPDITADLTQEEKVKLVMKWGRLYKLDELVSLELDYAKMKKSFTIEDADSENTLILLCKTNLKSHQALDCGDIDGYQKLSKVADSLRKSGKFTAAQNKEDNKRFMDSASAIVYFCEKNKGAIPIMDISEDRDIVDTIIRDFKQYYQTLVYSDKALAQQIESYLKRREMADEALRQKIREKTLGESINHELTDEEIAEHYERIAEEAEEDLATITAAAMESDELEEEEKEYES